MKKLLLLTLALMAGLALMAQGSRKTTEYKSALAFHAGPSFPMGDFSSCMPDNEEAGLAKPGITLGLNYQYLLNEQVGITVSGFYNFHKTDKLVFEFDWGDEGTETVTMTADNWHFYGISAGPSLQFSLNKNLSSNLHVLGGVANVRLPAFYYNDEEMTRADWGIGPVIQGGMDLKLNAGKQFFIFLNGEYQYMRPTFRMLDIWTDESDKVYQKISVLNVTGGIGFRF